MKGTLSVLRETHGVFAKFISGKIIDSLLVGILTFIIMSIAGVPYTLLISVVIGVTNIHSIFWTVYWYHPQCDPGIYCQSDQRNFIFDPDHYFNAGGWKYHRSEDFRRFHWIGKFLDPIFHFSVWVPVWNYRNDLCGAGICHCISTGKEMV